ncbi:protein YgfX [Rouxiella badensis]|uniref:protein YgfX n=1 Tax=Rouxiella badensis TaxID=1646377 RepID=UPI001D138FF0|nr:protein YgfX [Rouxiella badensis]MCC3749191.1 protein YgfX [Rouxiella badensis]
MALWQCDLRVSWRSQLFSLAVHGILILLILLAPWPPDDWMIWLILLIIVVSQSIRSQRRISARQGEISLLAQDRLLWRKQEWKIKQPVWMIDSGILLSLRRERTGHGWRQALRGKKHKLWLASDSMSQQEWRHLRQILLTGKRDAAPANNNHHPL